MPSMLAKYAQRAVPRYTSYPAAPHFAPGFPEAVYRDWLARLDPDEPVSLYVHIPFCRRICWYCGCNMKLSARYAPVAAYVQSLIAEIGLLAAALPARMPVAHLHFGGGTPSALSPEDLAAIMERLGESFRITPATERAIECDPRTLIDAMIERIGALGFNRASFGVQEFDRHVQAAINRIQPFETVARATEGLRAAGVRGINFDLIHGLPYQTVTTVRRTVELCMELRPDRIALFGYAHVPWFAKNQRMIPEESLPGARERVLQAEAAGDALTAASYVRIGIDHFALPDDALAIAAANDRLRRNFQGYTSDPARVLIGLGATAIGRAPKGYVQNIAETGAWSRSISEGRLPVARGHVLSAQDALRGEIIERIMCGGTADLLAAGKAFGLGKTWFAGEEPALAALASDGLITFDRGRLALTPAGAPLRRIVAATFDTYLRGAATRHSLAV